MKRFSTVFVLAAGLVLGCDNADTSPSAPEAGADTRASADTNPGLPDSAVPESDSATPEADSTVGPEDSHSPSEDVPAPPEDSTGANDAGSMDSDAPAPEDTMAADTEDDDVVPSDDTMPTDDTMADSGSIDPNACSAGALQLDGSNCVHIPNVFDDTMSTYTLEFWARIDAIHADWPSSVFVDQIESPGLSLPGMRVELQNNGPAAKKMHFMETTTGGSSLGGYVGSVWDIGTWHHVAFVRSPTSSSSVEVCTYIDGSLFGTCAEYDQAQPHVANADPLRLGCSNNTEGTLSHYLIGAIDELRVSNVARYDGDFDPNVVFKADESTRALFHFEGGDTGGLLDDSTQALSGSWDGTATLSEDVPLGLACN